MSKYKTANTNKYIDKNKSQTIEKQLTPDSIGDNYFQKVISPSTPFNSMSKSAIIQKKELPPLVQEIIDYVKSLSENPENKKLIENLLGSANNTISNLGTSALGLVNRGAYHGLDALQNTKLLNRNRADRLRFGILSAAAEEGLPTEELRSKAFEDLKRLYSKKFPNNRWDALRRDPSGESFNDPFFRSPKIMTDENHPIHLQRELYTEGRNRLGTGLGVGLGLGGGAALAAQGFNNEQKDGYEMPGSNKSMLKGNTKKRGSVRKDDWATDVDSRAWNAPFVSPQRPKNFGFPSKPTSNYPGITEGYNPSENAVRQSMPTDYDISEYTQGNTDKELMEALKAYAGKTFNNTKPFLDATLFNSDAWNNNFTQPLTNSFNSNVVDPIDQWLRSLNPGKPPRINDPDNPNLGKRMSKRMHKRMDEDMAVTPRKVSTNRSISSKNKYFK